MRSHRLIHLLLAALMSLPGQFAPAAQIILKSAYKARRYQDREMERLHLLAAGSIVEIPDRFVVLGRDGTPNFDLTLNRWLKEEGHLGGENGGPGRYRYDGEKHDYFFPVKVISAAKGSTAKNNEEYYLGLSHMARQRNGILVTDNSPVYAPPASLPSHRPEPASAETAATTGAPCSDCGMTPLQRLTARLSPVLNQVAKTRQSKASRLQSDLAVIGRTLRVSCGLNVNQFVDEIRWQLAGHSERAEIFIHKLAMESGGHCWARNSEHDESASIGLFQINSASSQVPRCTADQKTKMSGLSVAQLKRGPFCLENPVINLREAIRIYREKEQALFAGQPPALTDDQRRDRERIITVAYNGGELYVIRARQDLERFNQLHGSKLDVNKWSDLKPFFFRQTLKANEQVVHFGGATPYRGRSRNLLISNVAHAEALVPDLDRQPARDF